VVSIGGRASCWLIFFEISFCVLILDNLGLRKNRVRKAEMRVRFIQNDRIIQRFEAFI